MIPSSIANFLGAGVYTNDTRPTLQCVQVSDYGGQRVAVATNGSALHMVRGVDMPVGVHRLHVIRDGGVLETVDLKYPEWQWLMNQDWKYLPATVPILPATAAKALRAAGYAAMLATRDDHAEVSGYLPVSIPRGVGMAIIDPILLHDALRHMPGARNMANVKIAMTSSERPVSIVCGDYQAIIMPMIGGTS